MNYDRSFAERMKQNYPPGTRIELDHMDDPFAPIPSGTRGTVIHVDDIGQIHLKWDNGRGLALVPGEDAFHKLSKEDLHKEQLPKKVNDYAEKIENDILPNIDFDRLKAEYVNNDDTYIKEIVGGLHELFVQTFGTDEVDSTFGYLDVPGIVESQNTGDIFPALLNTDFTSSGDIMDALIITPNGIRDSSSEIKTQEDKAFFEELGPYNYWYTLRCQDDIYTSLDNCPSDIKDILVECNENLFEQTGGMNLC